jgi:hypothetical protein
VIGSYNALYTRPPGIASAASVISPNDQGLMIRYANRGTEGTGPRHEKPNSNATTDDREAISKRYHRQRAFCVHVVYQMPAASRHVADVA